VGDTKFLVVFGIGKLIKLQNLVLEGEISWVMSSHFGLALPSILDTNKSLPHFKAIGWGVGGLWECNNSFL
jgi:hypothetical protein